MFKKLVVMALLIPLFSISFSLFSQAHTEEVREKEKTEEEPLPPLQPIIPDYKKELIKIGKKSLIVESSWVIEEGRKSKDEYDAQFRVSFHQEFSATLKVMRARGYSLSQGELLYLLPSRPKIGPLHIDTYNGNIRLFHKKGAVEDYEITQAWTNTEPATNGNFEASAVIGTGVFKELSHFQISGRTNHIMLSHPKLWARETTIGETEGKFNIEFDTTDIAKLWEKGFIRKEYEFEMRNENGYIKKKGILDIYLLEYGVDTLLYRVKIFNKEMKEKNPDQN